MAFSRYILLLLIQLYAVSAWSLEQNGSLVGFQSGLISHDTVNGRMRVDLVQTPPNSDSSFHYEGAVGSHLPVLVKNKEYRLDFRLDRGASPLRRLKVMLLPSRMLIADISAPSALLTVDTLGISDSVSFRFAAVDSLMSVVIVGESNLSENYYYIKDFELLERQDQVENTSKSKGGQPYTERSRYRYGFGGQEIDDEIYGRGNSYTANFWEYDSRLGRRWNPDPKYTASESRYATFGNNPIFYTDPLGDFKTKFGAWAYKTTHGGEIGGEKGNYYVNRSSVENGVVTIRPWVYDWQGNTKPYTGSGLGHSTRSLAANVFGVNGTASNLWDMGMNSMLQNSSVQLTGNILDKVKQDPAVQNLENTIVGSAQSDSRFGKEAFTFNYQQGVQLGGQRGSLNPLDPSSAATWQVAGNPLTWAVRSVNIEAQVKVSAEGCMNITYSFTDNFDLRPEKGGKVYFGEGNRPWQYNATTSILGLGYHDLFGGNDKMKVNATWQSER